MLQELAILSRCVNPKVTWCFMGEDQMQRMQQIAKACVRGNKVDQQTLKLARHYRLALHLHFLELAHWTWKGFLLISKPMWVCKWFRVFLHRHAPNGCQFGGSLNTKKVQTRRIRRKKWVCSVLLLVVRTMNWDGYVQQDCKMKRNHVKLFMHAVVVISFSWP